jgi:hypothetical protein
VRACFGGFAEGVAFRPDPAPRPRSQFVADDYQRELAFLGIASSPAFVREPEGNGCVERFIRTLKENLLWVHRFATIEELRLALLEFQRTYNQTWIVERSGRSHRALRRRCQDRTARISRSDAGHRLDLAQALAQPLQADRRHGAQPAPSLSMAENTSRACLNAALAAGTPQ